ncbi:MAG: sulfite exporter TauE/SafE family protein [Candidatus Velthaea sp.]
MLRLVFGVAPSVVSGTSLLFVTANVLTSSIGYLRQKRVDLALWFPLTIGALPGSILGVLVVHHVSAQFFDIAYGCILLIIAALVIRRRTQTSRLPGERTFAHGWPVALTAGLVLGILSSLFGIGGGIVLVPLLLIAARMPPHVVSATTGFVVLCTAPVGVVGHGYAGDIDWNAAIPLIAGGLVGGSLAPSIAKRTSSPRLLTLLVIALLVAAGSLVIRHL